MLIRDRKRVLIVDNDNNILSTLQGVLERAGFDTRITWSGREALALLAKSDEVEVLLVDDYLPDLYYKDFLRRVSVLPIQPWIVVMQAAAPTASDVRQCASLGAAAVVRKHHLGEICEAVSACFRGEPGQDVGELKSEIAVLLRNMRDQ